MTIGTGDKIPSVTLRRITEDGPEDVDSDTVFAGRNVVVFGLPGAYTPTCSLNHLPGFVENRDIILANGVDEIVCVSVNDHFVMKAWAEATGAAGAITFIADWDAGFTRAIGMDIDLSMGGLGVRSQRYSMLVEDGVVKLVNLEDSPGEAVVSGAARILEQIG
ncbi:peroxiredoxin [Oricola sp.]|uniref:peroxiredoxin n=1 Tax=Oricola sp. TaxID=1979950 RepID=UPI003BA85B73